jgi:16S rRNA U516 pseudouridylate synthase RsuA-like enzyme
VVCVALLIFIGSVIVAAIYREMLRKHVQTVSDGLFRQIRRFWLAFERKVTRL